MKLCAILFVFCGVFLSGPVSATPSDIDSGAVSGTVSGAVSDRAPDMTAFGKWPVLHEGRVKTMDSFARAVLYEISEKTHTDNMSATEWLALTLFDPYGSIALPVIRIDNVAMLDLPERDAPYYTLNEAMAALRPHQELLLALDRADPASLSAPQKRLLDVYAAVSVYNQLVQSFSPVLLLEGGETDATYLSARHRLDALGEKFASRINTDNMSENDRLDLQLFTRLSLIGEGGKGNDLLRFIPSTANNAGFVSLWQTVLGGHGSPVAARITELLGDMAASWSAGDFDRWSALAQNIGQITIHHPVVASMHEPWKLRLENLYVGMKPDLWVMLFYAFGVLSLVAGRPVPAGYACLAGAGLHLAMLVVRSLILGRPPTGTLYETILFASAAIVVFAGILYTKNRNGLILGGGLVAALILLFISRGFIQGDSLNVLVAVLNTNFWLATHVTCIVTGYGACIIAAVTGHLYLAAPYLRARNRISQAMTDGIAQLMMPLALVALLFTSVGTLLGGIWADQSWGRFWGWDPKENGALLIVLWLAWILHGRVSGHFRSRGFAAALALTNVAVAVTWFGVNLLGVGLHSYGFISGIAAGLAAFCVFQIITVAILLRIHKNYSHGA